MADSPPVAVAADASGSADATETADDAHFTSAYGFHNPGTRWTESSEKGGWKWVRRLSVNHPVIKQGQDFTHMCIKPMPDGKIGCGEFFKMKDRKTSQLTSSGGHFTRWYYCGRGEPPRPPPQTSIAPGERCGSAAERRSKQRTTACTRLLAHARDA
jgi:hypothetical protein